MPAVLCWLFHVLDLTCPSVSLYNLVLLEHISLGKGNRAEDFRDLASMKCLLLDTDFILILIFVVPNTFSTVFLLTVLLLSLITFYDTLYISNFSHLPPIPILSRHLWYLFVSGIQQFYDMLWYGPLHFIGVIK